MVMPQNLGGSGVILPHPTDFINSTYAGLTAVSDSCGLRYAAVPSFRVDLAGLSFLSIALVEGVVHEVEKRGSRGGETGGDLSYSYRNWWS